MSTVSCKELLVRGLQMSGLARAGHIRITVIYE